MEHSSLKAIGMIAKIAAAIGLILLFTGSIVNLTGSSGAGAIAIGGAFVGFAFVMIIIWLVVDAITESIDQVRETIVARWIDDPEHEETSMP